MGARILIAFVVLSIAPVAARADGLTESEVIQRAQRADPDVTLARAGVTAAETRAKGVAPHPNPVLGWNREHVPNGAPREREDSVFLTVPIDLSGRRAAQQNLARADATASRASAARVRGEAVRRALHVYYAAIAAERRAEILERATRRLDEAARVLERREQEGTLAGYERHRLQIEAELARSELEEARAEARTLRSELSQLLERNVTNDKLESSLTVRASHSGSKRVPERRSVALARQSAADAHRAVRSSESAWLPLVSLTGGIKIARTDETALGYVIGAAVELPLFDRAQDVSRGARARQLVASAEARTTARHIAVEAARASTRFESAKSELSRFERATGDSVSRLHTAAASSYREGHRSLMELLDAERARTSVERRRLDLAFNAKRAEIDLRAASGEFE